MQLHFSKMHGLGNDFIVIDLTSSSPNFGARLTTAHFKFLADRHYGVGADQILLIENSNSAAVDFNYRIINADGGEVGNCGNGVRCLMQYALENGLTQKNTLTVKTSSATMRLSRSSNGDIKVDMGMPDFTPANIPFLGTNLSSRQVGAATFWTLPLSSATVELAVVSMGNPHAVILVDNVATTDIVSLGKAIQQSAYFPQQVNVNFGEIINRRCLKLRTFERGSGATLACGTGACASAAAAILADLLDFETTVIMPGGRLTVQWQPSQHLYMSGSATTVFSATIQLSDN